MDANARKYVFRTVVGAIYEVANTLGPGFLEKVYERALVRELNMRGLQATPQAPFSVYYKGQLVGEYLADVLVENEIVLELKCVDSFAPAHIAQCINYLKASDRRIALLVNFQNPKVEWKRIVLGL